MDYEQSNDYEKMLQGHSFYNILRRYNGSCEISTKTERKHTILGNIRLFSTLYHVSKEFLMFQKDQNNYFKLHFN